MIKFKLDYGYFRAEAMKHTGQHPFKEDVCRVMKRLTAEHNCHIEEHTNFNSWSTDFYGKCTEEDFIIFKLKHPDAIQSIHKQSINPYEYPRQPI